MSLAYHKYIHGHSKLTGFRAQGCVKSCLPFLGLWAGNLHTFWAHKRKCVLQKSLQARGSAFAVGTDRKLCELHHRNFQPHSPPCTSHRDKPSSALSEISLIGFSMKQGPPISSPIFVNPWYRGPPRGDTIVLETKATGEGSSPRSDADQDEAEVPHQQAGPHSILQREGLGFRF